ncbi:MAG TPA: hypothetical protein VK633_08465, partial [Verrucomicrobiae bacterium]|nr:hypothetical protein [Verrucomicrobiae bacterium]
MSLEDRLYPLLAFYERMPRSAKWLAGAGFRQIPERYRRGQRYREFKQLAEEGEHWDAKKIEEFQFLELRRVLLHAQEHCPYYREQFQKTGFDARSFNSLESLERAPLLTKKDLLEEREQMVSSAFPESARLYITTGGSTGVPVGFYLQKGISRPKEQAFLETMWKRAGYFDGARLALLRGQVTSAAANGRISSYDATRDWLMLSSSHLAENRLDSYLRELERFKPDLLYVYPSSALRLVELSQAAGIRWSLPLKAILCGSERLTEPQRRMLEETFHCRAYSWYGHTERVILAAEGRNTNPYYFVPQYGFAEFGPPNAEGLREVIGTSFHNLVMPLIRYRTGDYVRLADKTNALEYPVPAASEIAG